MPGFVDVSNMSDEQIRRMGHADDDYESPRRFGRGAPVAQIGYAISDVWAAACAADRVNDGYCKEAVYEWDAESQVNKIVKRRNRDIMMEFLANPDRLLVEDVEAGERVRNFLQNDLTFRAVKGRLTDFDSAVGKCLAVQDRFYTVSQRYELAVVAALPASVKRSEARQNTEQRVKFARGGLIGKVGDKVKAQVEVTGANYSKNYNIYWISGVTDQDQPVFFSYKESFDAGTWLTIQGTVKGYRDNITQLNRVKVL